MNGVSIYIATLVALMGYAAVTMAAESTITAQFNGKCVEINRASTATGARVVQRSCNGKIQQKFNFVAASGGYKIVAANSGKCVGVPAGDVANGTRLRLDACATSGNHQIFKFQKESDSSYRLINLQSNKCMNISGFSKVDGGQVIQWACVGDINDKFLLSSPPGASAPAPTPTPTPVPVPVADIVAPSAPSNLQTQLASASQINLSYSASTDNVGVNQYRIERCLGSACTNFAQVASLSGLSYSNTGLAANTAYRFRVRAADAAGNLSAYSSIVSATTPAVVTEPPPASGSSLRGWQLSEANTGLAGAGVDRNSLPVYTGPSTPAAGTVIRLVKITTPLFLHKGNITLDRVWFQPTSTSGQGSLIFTYDPSFSVDGAGPVTIMDSDLDGSKITDTRVYTDAAVRGAANLYRNNIFGVGSGIAIFGTKAMPNIVVEQNYVHDLRAGMYGSPAQQSHNESATIRSFNGVSLTFRNNRLVSKSGSDSGALFIQAWAGAINNVLVESNLFETYGWCLPLEANQSGYGNNMRARDNRFVRGGYGPAYVTGGPGWAEWSGNYLYDANQADAKGSVVNKP